MDKKALILGISGQDGAYLSKFLVTKGYTVVGTTRKFNSSSIENIARLGISEELKIIEFSASSPKNVKALLENVQPDEIYNLASVSSVSLSYNDPLNTFNSIVSNTLNILNSILELGLNTKFYTSSSAEIFGNKETSVADEQSTFAPVSPYAVGKASSNFVVDLYRSAYGIFACTGIMFNHESPLRPPTFVTRKIVDYIRAVEAGNCSGPLNLGDLSVKRDWGWAPEYVEAMWRMLAHDEPMDYVVATGVSQTLEELVNTMFSMANLQWQDYVEVDKNLYRKGESKYSIGCYARAQKNLNWQPKVVGEKVAEKLYAGSYY